MAVYFTGGLRMSRLTIGLSVFILLILLPTPSWAAAVVLCTETDSGATAGDAANGLQQGGCVATIPTSAPPLIVASDGDVDFDPFGAGFDTSNQIVLNEDWLPDPRFPQAFAPGFWTELFDATGNSRHIWVLPSNLPCGSGCEPAGRWYFAPGVEWEPDTPDHLLILASNGAVSNQAWILNEGPNGEASISFSPLAIPEPGTMTLLGAGIAALTFWRSRKTA
jgi:hypothetical protein